MSFYNNNVEKMVGVTVQHIYMNQDHLQFATDKGRFPFSVTGDCCSSSYFWDFHGVKKLLAGNPIVKVEKVDLDDPNDENSRAGDVVKAYGYRFTTEDPKVGEVTSIMSFRNDSNGYYGGDMKTTTPQDGVPEITDDLLETPNAK